ncbi:endolytic transglycosylase MltG [Marinomonas mediterranea]|jgi:conserved hypothetical protein, YceG family|uniref:Endolytic murein transglycosylase n=1 Tax=Marinomonas mediterranea (strain ATCC 700492 / JCM 21426 / NBRC 103028 / MMB-1) TaxID=717774 RepID=F2JTM0_MARM1|nr:endolytic transglycosylase MltG [Marinomonas mediterranea]ADZ91534.1 aminodeoxychorismate lyase [Marinomonas mediterranea MMB-1]WCN09498.1 endolytic transglycosylase MltG [Marinomonas mediterranea]WCN13573.1 endolytic transglycosylase MltG [Marinomonas mediterranea]WCN17639.1 endolytic transglycosylase MltG [Marinomonas mediterranea MMB-1]
MSAVKWLVSLIFLLLTLMAAAAGGVYYGVTQPLMIDEAQEYEVQSGSSSTRIGQQLAARGWIYHPMLTKVVSRLNPTLVPKKGRYLIEPGQNLIQVFQLFDSGKAIYHEVTLLEGKTVKDYISTLAAKGNIEMTMEGFSAERVAEHMKLGYPSAEGLFFANTYRYHDGDTDVDILRHANALLIKELKTAWGIRHTPIPIKTSYDALILASIIEKETGVPYERPLISKVFMNRLKRKIRLQTDPTVIYGLGDQYNGNITRKDLRSKTPYNTYVIKGLPPTPIANVGKEAILAAVQPGETAALYFVAKGDGTHAFSRTLREHNNAVAKYQKFQRRKDYQSSPTK